MKKFLSAITCFFKEEEGASAVEYGILVALIAVAIIAVVTALGGKLGDVFQIVVDKLTAVAPAPVVK